jgi:CTP:molybdopterin cytidylyltransferase MocA
MTQTLGVVRAAGPQASIAGGPTPLLQTGSGTLLEGAIRQLRDVGVERIIATIHAQQEPVAAQARRQGAETRLLPTGEAESLSWILRVLGEGAPPLPPGSRILLLHVDAPLLAHGTLHALLAAGDGAATAPTPMSAPTRFVPIRSRDGTGPAPEAAPADAVGDPEAAGATLLLLPHGLAAATDDIPEPASVPVFVEDRHAALRIRDLPTYRRHFPEAFRRRFQKW